MGRKIAYAMFLAAVLSPRFAAVPMAVIPNRHNCPPIIIPSICWEKRRRQTSGADSRRCGKQVSKRSAAYLTSKMGENYFTQQIAPIVLDSWYQVFVPKKFGEIGLKSPLRAVDKTASGIIAAEQKHLSKWVEQIFPAFPVVGNIASDLLESQKLSFSNGLPDYRMRSKKRIALSYQWGKLSLAGGTETRFAGKNFNGMTFVTTFRYEGQNESYGVNILGKGVNFKIDINHLKADVTWEPDGVEFKVDLTLRQ